MAQGDGITSVTLSSGDRSVTLDGSSAAKAEAALRMVENAPQGAGRSLKESLADDLRDQGLTVETDAAIPLPQPTLAGAVVAEIGRRVPGAYYDEGGALHIDGDGLAEAARRIDTATGEVRRGARDERRTLVTGGNAERRAAIPDESRFVDRDGVQTDYLAGPDIARIANALINTDDDLSFLEGVKIHYLWRRKGRKKAARAVLGTCQKLSGLARYSLGGGEFLIILDAENCEEFGLSAWQLEALVYHELNHIAPPEEDEAAAGPTLVGHDTELFNAEIRRYGLWKSDLRITSKAFNDLPLFAGLREE